MRHLDRWLDYFQMSQILVVDGENIKVKPWEEMERVETFLGLSHKVGVTVSEQKYDDIIIYNYGVYHPVFFKIDPLINFLFMEKFVVNINGNNNKKE